jgi:hypothetical protein
VDYGAILFNVSLKSNQDWAYERLLNRINRTMQAKDEYAMLLCDEGNDWEYITHTRRIGVYNPIPSQYGTWMDGKSSKNLTTDRIIEDPLFKKSHQSTYIQLVDFCSYALLRHDKHLDSKNAVGLHEAFPLLEPVCFKQAAPKNPFGVIR